MPMRGTDRDLQTRTETQDKCEIDPAIGRSLFRRKSGAVSLLLHSADDLGPCASGSDVYVTGGIGLLVLLGWGLALAPFSGVGPFFRHL
jgi:hypothetical protein